MPKNAEPALFGDDLAAAPEPIAVAALAVWNEIAGAAGWAGARFLTQSRRTAMRRAVKDYGGLAGWKTHLAAASKNDFLTGKTGRDDKHRNWRPDLDWFLKPANVLKILEDKFPDSTKVAAPVQLPADPHADDRRKLRNYRPGGRWIYVGIPRPEDPRCTLAAPVLEEWRSINRVTVAAPVRETLEERLAGMERSYRKIGNHAKADSLLIELAQVRGEELVTLPPRPEPGGTLPNGASNAGGKFNVAKRDTSAAVDVEPEYDALPEAEDFGDE